MERCLLAEGTDRNGSNPQSQKTAYGPSPVEPRVTQDPYRKAGPFKRNLGQGKGSPGKAFLGGGACSELGFSKLSLAASGCRLQHQGGGA